MQFAQLKAAGYHDNKSQKCFVCREWIYVGEPIARDPDFTAYDGWSHDKCVPDEVEINNFARPDFVSVVDMVNHPPHYTAHPSGVECIQITEHMNFNIGNAVKYLWRADLKNGLEDLEKAAWYVAREIERRKAL